ncbi:MAG: FAD:protein FMN transferase [Paenacidovorax caeni]
MTNALQGGRLSRRRFALALPLLGALPWAAHGSAVAAGPQRASRNLMGTRVDIVADAPDARLAQAAIAKSFAEMQRLEALLSRYHADSVVRRIGAAAGHAPVPVVPEVLAVLHSAARVYRERGRV